MRRIIFYLMSLWLTCFSAGAKDFTYTYLGQTIEYTVLDEENKTCGTKSEELGNYPKPIKGSLILPEKVYDGDAEYTLVSIGENCFEFCTELMAVQIPGTVLSIGDEAFDSCRELKTLVISDSEEVINIGRNAFYGVELSEIYLGRPWKNNSTHPFYKYMTSYSITLGNSITRIEPSLFDRCPGLINIELPASLKEIGANAFFMCTGLTSIDIPSSVETIRDSAFKDCTDLTSVNLGYSLIKIGWEAFSGCTGLTSIEIPNSVTYLGRQAFKNCSGLTSVALGNSITEIGDETFVNCTSLRSIKIPDSVTSIGEQVFAYCKGLTSINIPGEVTAIGTNAFLDCTGLTRAEFTSIESLCKIDFNYAGSNPLSYAHNLWINGEEIEILNIPSSVSIIKPYTFYGCSGLRSVTIPETVRNIDKFSFYGCSGITLLYLPPSFSEIGTKAFGDCDGLENVYYPVKGLVNTTDSEVFSNIAYRNSVLWVPEKFLDVCKRIEPWRNFYDIRQYDFDAGIDNLIEEFDEEAEYEVYDLNGVKIGDSTSHLGRGVYILRQGNKAKKVVL